MKTSYDIGVIIARFQISELDKFHKIIQQIINDHKKVIILLGVSATLGTGSNPLGYDIRYRMINFEYPDIIIVPILDTQFDREWSKNIDKLVRAIYPIGSVCLYGEKENVIDHYYGLFDTFKLEPITEESDTIIEETSDFRRGIIFACNNQFPRIFPTVDIAVTRKSENGIEVFMGKRKLGMGWRFLGGFIDSTDPDAEYAARRELGEESGIEGGKIFRYIGSNLQDDWRYNTSDARIMTFFYQCEYVSGTGMIKEDEFDDFSWIEVKKDSDDIEDAHKVLFQMLVDFVNNNRSLF